MTVNEIELVASFYEAAFDAALWPEALRQLGELQGSVGAGLVIWDGVAGRVAHVANGGGMMESEASVAYERYYARIDTYRPLIAAAPLGAWLPCATFFDQHYVARSELYNDFLIPHGVRHLVATRLLEVDDFTAFVAIHRGPRQAPFSPPEIRRLEDLSRNLRRAIKLFLHFARARLEHEVSSIVLDRLETPAMLVDATGRVLFCNAAAEAVLRHDEGINVQQGHLRAARSSEDSRLQALIADAASTFGRTGGEMLMERPAGQQPIVLLISPIGPMTAHGLPPITAGALVLFNDPARQARQPAKRLQALFGLTKAEAMLAQALLDGHRLTEIADTRRVSIETVRTQLQSLLKKTGVTRQADLMRILLTLPDASSGSRYTGHQTQRKVRG
jgi:DNA-binding CsgD family transcriptional regulator